MGVARSLGLAALALGGGAAAFGLIASRRDARSAETAWRVLRDRAEPHSPTFDPAQVADLPAVARRYFDSAIAPGTPLHRVVEIAMAGEFILNGRPLPMRAEQILAPPHGFVWRARIGRGALRFAGSDGYLAGEESWTRFRLLNLLPLVRTGGSEDHARAAAARMAMETIWLPAALLPQYGALWRQTGPDRAEVAFPAVPGIEPVAFRFDAEGRIIELTTQRWSDANPERRLRLHPFGGRMLAHGVHQGFTVPTEMEIGNSYGTPDYAPFFRASLTWLHYGGHSP